MSVPVAVFQAAVIDGLPVVVVWPGRIMRAVVGSQSAGVTEEGVISVAEAAGQRLLAVMSAGMEKVSLIAGETR
jgi:hypothetical protein